MSGPRRPVLAAVLPSAGGSAPRPNLPPEGRAGGAGARPRAAPPALRAVGGSEQAQARFHRESDRRRLRAMAVALCGAAALVGLILGVVGLRVQQVRLSYRLDRLREARADMEESNRRLGVELATLRSLARIEGKARAELGMVPPASGQVRLAREFVPGGGGVAGGGPRTALVERAARQARPPGE